MPLRGLLQRGEALDESAWIQVPFVGFAFSMIGLQFQLHLDIAVNRGVFGLWAVATVLWLLWLWKGQVRRSFRALPLLPFATAAVVLAVQGWGLFLAGPDDYVGRSWGDQFNYTTMAECFRYHGFGTTFDNMGQRPWLLRTVELQHGRVGQSVLQAYHGVITGMETQSLFMPTSLLSCPLIVLALYACARAVGLDRRQAALAGLFAGLVPGVTMLVQESFQSHGLAISFLLLLSVPLTNYLVQRDAGSLGTAALCLGGLTSIYTDFLLMELVLVVAFLVLAICQRPRSVRRLSGYAVLLAAPWLFNPLHQQLFHFLSPDHLGMTAFTHVYPWAMQPTGMAVLWLGDFCVRPEGQAYLPAGVRLGVVIMGGGAVGLLTLAISATLRWWRAGRRFDQASGALPLALLGLASIPGLLLFCEQNYSYQFYKLLLTVSPLYALGVVALGAKLAWRIRHLPLAARPQLLVTAAIWLPVLLATAVAAHGSFTIAADSADPHQTTRTYQHLALDADFRALRQELQSLRGHNLLYRPSPRMPNYYQLWTMYFGRHNQVWMADPTHNDAVSVLSRPDWAHLGDLTKLPADCLVLTPRPSMFLQPPRALPEAAIVWQSAGHTLWRPGQRPWACIAHVENPNGIEPGDDRTLWLGGGASTYHFFASQAGVYWWPLALSPGPCIDAGESLRLRIDNGRGTDTILENVVGLLVVPLFLERGITTVTVEVLNAKRRAAGADPRPLLARMQVQDGEFHPQSAGSPWVRIARVNNPYGFEDAGQRMIWLGGGDTTIQLWAAMAGTAHLEIEVTRGPCLDPAEPLTFQVTGSTGRALLRQLEPGRRDLQVPVVQGLNVISVRPSNVPSGTIPGDPRRLVSLWKLGGVSLDAKEECP
jgi:hypothetical protein